MHRALWIVLGLVVVGWCGKGWAYEVDSSTNASPSLPKGIKELSVTQPPAAASDENPADDAVSDSDESKTPPQRVSMDFQDANLKDILKIFSQQTGINVIASAGVGDQPITLYLEDVTVMDALDRILQSGNLVYERPVGSDIYIVKPKEQGPKATITRVYRLRYARVSESVLAKAAASFGSRTPYEASKGLGSSGSSSGGSGGGGGSLGGGSLGGGGGGGGGGQVGIDPIIKRLLTSQGDIIVDPRTNSLIITDVPENFPRIEAAVASLDVRTAQIMIDTEVLETSLVTLKNLGVQWGAGTDGTFLQLFPGERTTPFPFNTFSDLLGRKGAPLSQGTVTAGLATAGLGPTQPIAVLNALESSTDTKILARPKVLTLDNESAVIKLVSDEAIGFTSGSQATTGSVTATPERETTGVILSVTPQVNDGGYITMLIEPAVTKTVASNISAPSGQPKPRDPKTRSVRSLVRVHSGDTLVVGGLIDRTDTGTVQRVPVMSGIPFLGEAFKYKSNDNNGSELIVFLTPHLLDEPTQAQVASVAPGAMGAREQEPNGTRQQKIEESLNALEQAPKQ